MQPFGKLSVLLAVCAAGCGSDDPAQVGPDTAQDGGSIVADPDAGPISGLDSGAVCSEGQTLSCVCADAGVGTQTCSGGVYGTCQGCQSVPASKCAPGFYHGGVTGTYRSSASGIPGLFAPTNEDDNTEWRFVLAPSGASSEFFTLGNGCIHLIDVTGEQTDDSERFLLTGNLNCATGLLTGEVRGYYSGTNLLDGSKTRYYYKGQMQGTYDPATKSFIDTSYKVSEPSVLLGDQPGGSGTWKANFVSDSAPDVGYDETADIDACLGTFPADDMFPPVTL